MASQTRSIQLAQPLERIPGIDSRMAGLLKKLGVHRALDLLFLFPRDYQEPAPMVPVEQFSENLRVTFLGTVEDMADRVTQSGKHMLGVQVTPDGGGCVRLIWFNQPFRKRIYQRGDRLMVTGCLQSTGLNWEMVQPLAVVVDTRDSDSSTIDPLHPLPVYPLTEGLKQSNMRSLIKRLLPQLVAGVEEALPEWVRQELDVLGIHPALRAIHLPETMQDAHAAQRRFKLQELLVLQLALSIQRCQREQSMKAPACESTGKIHARILSRLGHELTGDQQAAIEDIRADMARTIPMNRLLQGDVGSGKTLVAQYAMLVCVANDHQAALMAPTEVLARQHAASLEKNLAHSRVRVGLLTGGLKRKQRAEMIERIGQGQVDLVVGTQALLSEDVEFKKLGLVIVDEQHKFGVLQRARMRRDEIQPHCLTLSATPIPRTIAMTAFGDLDLSSIREKPPGRAQVNSYVTSPEQLESWWKFVDRQIDQGRQAYVITPRVSTSAEGDAVASAEGAFQSLGEGPFRHRRLGLLHGKMSAEEKEAILEQFVARDLDILVATTVVEVGIDVPNATVITILDADRLGLSQLHQLRGRIARSRFVGYACAVTSIGCEAAENQRLQAFVSSDDGFQLAEMDLQLRGPGDLLGTSQTGLPPLRIANLIQDADLLDLARRVARDILVRDPQLEDPQLKLLLRQTLRRYGSSLQLGDVG
jgi:ATP-dependent DNA helicase RecG